MSETLRKEEVAKAVNKEYPYVIEMCNITKEFPGIIANDNITLQLKRGEIHALLGENGAGKSTLMSVLFGLYQPEKGEIRKNGEVVTIKDPNDANALGIGMVHQHFKLVDVFTVLDNIILGVEPNTAGFLRKKQAREKVISLSKTYGLNIDPDALVENITVGMQQRTEILKMLYRDNEILIFDEPTAVLTPQEIEELMEVMRGLAKEGKSILFITHKLNEIMAVADRCTVLRKGKYIGTVNIADTTKEELSNMMVGRDVKFVVDKEEAKPKDTVLKVSKLCVKGVRGKKDAVHNVSFNVREGEIVCIAGIDGNGQTEFVHALTGLCKADGGNITLLSEDITNKNVRYRNTHGMSHIPEDRHKHGLVLDYSLEENMVLQRYFEPKFQKNGFIRFDAVRDYANNLIERFDVRSGQGAITTSRSMSGGNQQKAIVAREMDREHKLLVAVQPTRGLDVGAIEYIHKQIVNSRDSGTAVLLVSLELEEVMSLSDRILVMYEGEIVGELDPKTTTVQELGLYMAGAKRNSGKEVAE
ncbi:MAG: ABC transporter ATP-binding protein [Oscillospiraceae bacterium]|nr:ABC transporter ATP-binding protein [Oscillospiraceae bacterium]